MVSFFLKRIVNERSKLKLTLMAISFEAHTCHVTRRHGTAQLYLHSDIRQNNEPDRSGR